MKGNGQNGIRIKLRHQAWLRPNFIEACKTQQTRNIKSNQIDTEVQHTKKKEKEFSERKAKENVMGNRGRIRNGM